MSPDNRARVFKTNPGPRHSRIAIGIDKIDLPAKKDVTVIRAAHKTMPAVKTISAENASRRRTRLWNFRDPAFGNSKRGGVDKTTTQMVGEIVSSRRKRPVKRFRFSSATPRAHARRRWAWRWNRSVFGHRTKQ